jgi:hypothetical protein
MKRWMITLGIIDCLLCVWALAPLLVTFAQLPPNDIQYVICDDNSVKAAMALARSGGIEFMRGFMSPTIYWLMGGIAVNFMTILFILRKKSI